DFHVTGVQTCALPIYCKEQLHVAPLARNKLLVLVRFYGVERCAALMVEVNPPPVRLRQRRRPETGPRLLEEARPQLTPAALDLRSEERRVGKECRHRT